MKNFIVNAVWVVLGLALGGSVVGLISDMFDSTFAIMDPSGALKKSPFFLDNLYHAVLSVVIPLGFFIYIRHKNSYLGYGILVSLLVYLLYHFGFIDLRIS